MQTTATRDLEGAAIVDVALDYFEGWFTADVERMRRALHPQLAKRRLGDDEDGLDESPAAEMVEVTAAGVGLRRGDEYLHLARTRDGWKIVNALWQWT